MHTCEHTRAHTCTQTFCLPDTREQLPVSVTAYPEHESRAQHTAGIGRALADLLEAIPVNSRVLYAEAARGLVCTSTFGAAKDPCSAPAAHTRRRNKARRF